MKTVSHRQSHANTESYDSAIATPKPPSLRDPHHEQPQPQTYDLSHVDLFSHDPGPRSVSNSRSVPNIVQANPQVEPVPALVQCQESEPEEAVQSDSEAHETSMAPPLQPPSEPGQPKGDSIQPQRLPAFNPSKGFAHLDLFSHAPRRDPIQMKLTVGEPGDRYEQEADRMADQVMRMAAPTAPPVQRQAEEEQAEIQAAPLVETITPVVQRQGNATEDPVQAKCETCEAAAPVQRVLWQASPKPTDTVQAQPDLERQLNASKGSESPLSAEVRSFMEPRFGADFSQVRAHTGSNAIQMNRDLNAQAFTHQQDVYFGAGKAPEKDALTAHELTHVVQQTGKVRTSSSNKLTFTAAPTNELRLEGAGSPHRVDVAVVLTDEAQDMKTAFALAPKVLRVGSIDDMRSQLQNLGVSIGTLHILSHGNADGDIQFSSVSGNLSWAKPGEIGAKLKGVLSADKAPMSVIFHGCKTGANPGEVDKFREGIGAASTQASNCWTFDQVSDPLTLGGTPITVENQVTPQNQQEFNKTLRMLATSLKAENSRSVKDCIVGLNTGETADKSFEKIKQSYFRSRGHLVAQWVSPEYNKNWQEGSKCFKDLTKTSKPCSLVESSGGKTGVLDTENSDSRLADAGQEVNDELLQTKAIDTNQRSASKSIGLNWDKFSLDAPEHHSTQPSANGIQTKPVTPISQRQEVSKNENHIQAKCAACEQEDTQVVQRQLQVYSAIAQNVSHEPSTTRVQRGGGEGSLTSAVGSLVKDSTGAVTDASNAQFMLRLASPPSGKYYHFRWSARDHLDNAYFMRSMDDDNVVQQYSNCQQAYINTPSLQAMSDAGARAGCQVLCRVVETDSPDSPRYAPEENTRLFSVSFDLQPAVSFNPQVGNPIEVSTVQNAGLLDDPVSWLAAATRIGEVYMSDVNSLVVNVLKRIGNRPISRLNILDHGNPDGMMFGSTWLDNRTISTYAPVLQRLQGHFTSGGFVHVQGCQVGQNLKLIRALADAFNVPVYAGTGMHNPIYRINYGDYVRCQSDGTCASNVSRP